jgi:pSer/pThr/pTyr-binding forkhead associated (FHA) protein
MCQVSILYPENDRQTVQIPETGLLVGRSSVCGLRLSDEFVSGLHCKIFSENGNLFIEDLGSTNGTAIDGTEIKAQCAMLIESGQNIQIGITEARII